MLAADEHELVRATAQRARALAGGDGGRGSGPPGPPGIERILALRAVPIFSMLPLEGLARLAGSSAEAVLAPGSIVCREGETGEEVFVLLEGETEIVRGSGSREEILGVEGVDGVIGEMAVLDPAPRAATVRAGPRGATILRLAGGDFRDVLGADPKVAEGVIRTLARRLRKTGR
jgi:CRP-like cAMP-binding protein